MNRRALVDLVATHQAEPALLYELRALTPDTTDDLPPVTIRAADATSIFIANG